MTDEAAEEDVFEYRGFLVERGEAGWTFRRRDDQLPRIDGTSLGHCIALIDIQAHLDELKEQC